MSMTHPPWWDSHSDQPFKLERSQKPRLRGANLLEYGRTGITAATLWPAIAWHYAMPVRTRHPPVSEFVGLGVSPDHGDHNAITELVDELAFRI